MKNELRILLDAKINLKEAQNNFKKVIKERYPFLLTQDISDYRKNINEELELLLSSTTRTASVRIVIPSKGIGYKDGVVLTRKPGLKNPYDSYSAFQFTNVKKIDEKDDFIIVDEDDSEDRKLVQISFLKTHGQILQDKLKVFYEFMKETVELMVGFGDFVPIHCYREDELPRIKIGLHRLKLRDEGFDLEVFDKNAKKGYDKWETIEANKIIEFSSHRYTDDEEAIEMQASLLNVLNEFELFDEVLKNQDRRKKQLVEKSEDLLNRLLEYNKPYKILRKLLIQT